MENMGIWRGRAAVVALACCLASSWASAESREGPYVFVSAGKSAMTNGCQSGLLPYLSSIGGTGTCSEKSVAYSAGFGWQYTPTWGLEVNFGKFGYANASGTANFGGTAGWASYSWQLKAVGVALQGTFTLHLGDDLAVLGKFGLARIDYTEYLYAWNSGLPANVLNYYWAPVVQESKNVPALGAGIQYDFALHGSVRLMVETYGSSDIYSALYGPTPKVRLTTASMALMYRY